MTPPLSHRARSIISRLKHAVTRGGGTYPLKGIYYFSTHRFLWPLIKTRLLPCTLLSLFILVNLFLWTYLPQVAVLALFHRFRGSAWLNGTVLVLSESAIVTALLFEAFFVDETQVDIFDAVLVARGHESLVSTSRPVLAASVNTSDASEVEASADGPAQMTADQLLEAGSRRAAAATVAEGAQQQLNPRTRLLKPSKSATYAPFSLRQIIEFILLLPLNLVPYIGVPLFLLLTGYRAGPLLHYRYFSLRGFNRRQRRAWIKRHQWEYTWFGATYLVLQLVPVLSMLFLLTSAAGGACWAADIEDERARVGDSGASDGDDARWDREQEQEQQRQQRQEGRYRDVDDGEIDYLV